MSSKVDAGADHDREIATVAKTFERTKRVYDAASPAVVEVSTTAGGVRPPQPPLHALIASRR
jgi:hypothetical protein